MSKSGSNACTQLYALAPAFGILACALEWQWGICLRCMLSGRLMHALLRAWFNRHASEYAQQLQRQVKPAVVAPRCILQVHITGILQVHITSTG